MYARYPAPSCRSAVARFPPIADDGNPRGFVIIAPGRVRTDMGGPNAPLGVEDSIPGVVDAIASWAGKSNLRFLDRTGREVRW